METPENFSKEWVVSHFGDHAAVVILDPIDHLTTKKEQNKIHIVKIVGVSLNDYDRGYSGLAVQWLDNVGHDAPKSDTDAANQGELYLDGICGSDAKVWFLYFSELKSFKLITIATKSDLAELINKLEL